MPRHHIADTGPFSLKANLVLGLKNNYRQMMGTKVHNLSVTPTPSMTQVQPNTSWLWTPFLEIAPESQQKLHP